MENRLTARELGAYVELKKRVAEEEYKLSYIKNTAGDHESLIEEIEEELVDKKAKMKIIEGKLEARRITLIVPNQERIEEYGELISRLPKDEVSSAIKNKSGDAYIYLAERGKLIKRNIENKNEIGKINILLTNAEPKIKACVTETLFKGEIKESDADFGTEQGKKLISLLNRVGIHCKLMDGKLVENPEDWNEGRVVVNNEYFWIPKDKIEVFSENEKLLATVSIKLQVKNAEMQAITFNEAQQKEFQELQTQYMDLLKSRKDLIGKEEEDLTLSI